MIYAYEASSAEGISMRATLKKHGLIPLQMTPRGQIVGVVKTASHHHFALVCTPEKELEQYALETLAQIVAEKQARDAELYRVQLDAARWK